MLESTSLFLHLHSFALVAATDLFRARKCREKNLKDLHSDAASTGDRKGKKASYFQVANRSVNSTFFIINLHFSH